MPVDTGYGNIKNSLHSFPTGIAGYKTKPAFEGKILHIGEMYYRIGEGHKEYIPDKTVDEEFRLLTIAAICDECHSCGYYGGSISCVRLFIRIIVELCFCWTIVSVIQK